MTPAGESIDGRYRTIVADPPWDYEGFATAPQGDRNRGLKPKKADLPYGSMSVPEICALPVAATYATYWGDQSLGTATMEEVA